VPQVRRRALNEAVFRQINEAIEKLAGAYRQERIEIVCECAVLGCAEPIRISLGAYEDARANPLTFVVAPGHTDPSIEVVIADHVSYMLVQKIGEAADEAIITSTR
jgi:hypothetical protein